MPTKSDAFTQWVIDAVGPAGGYPDKMAQYQNRLDIGGIFVKCGKAS